MKNIASLIILFITTVFLASCSKSDDPSATSSVTLSMSAATTDGKAILGGRIGSISGRTATDSTDTTGTSTGITISDVKVNVRDIKFEFDRHDRHMEEEHFKRDSAYSDDDDAKLKGPFLVDLMNAGSFIDQVITSVTLPNATYERVRFKLSPSKDSGEMNGKSIMITGKIDTTQFVFWHKRDENFGARFYNDSSSDSTSVSTTGTVVNMAIHFELDKILNALNGGVDLTAAVDGNHDGIITIDPDNTDGNKWLADHIMMLLVRHARCERHNH